MRDFFKKLTGGGSGRGKKKRRRRREESGSQSKPKSPKDEDTQRLQRKLEDNAQTMSLRRLQKYGLQSVRVIDANSIRDIVNTAVDEALRHRGANLSLGEREAVHDHAKARIMELLRCGFSLRRAFAAAAETMNRSRDPELSYAAFALARILNNGQATVLTYVMPSPVFVGKLHSTVLPQRTTTIETALVGECHAQVEPGEGLLLVSDGITQAGLGAGLAEGWTIDGVRHCVDRCLADRMPLHEIPRAVQ